MRQPLEPLVDLNYGENMKKIPTQNLVPPELIVEYEKQRMTTRFEPGDFDNLPRGRFLRSKRPSGSSKTTKPKARCTASLLTRPVSS